MLTILEITSSVQTQVTKCDNPILLSKGVPHQHQHINVKYNVPISKAGETEDPGENLRERSLIGKPFVHTARSGN